MYGSYLLPYSSVPGTYLDKQIRYHMIRGTRSSDTKKNEAWSVRPYLMSSPMRACVVSPWVSGPYVDVFVVVVRSSIPVPKRGVWCLVLYDTWWALVLDIYRKFRYIEMSIYRNIDIWYRTCFSPPPFSIPWHLASPCFRCWYGTKAVHNSDRSWPRSSTVDPDLP